MCDICNALVTVIGHTNTFDFSLNVHLCHNRYLYYTFTHNTVTYKHIYAATHWFSNNSSLHDYTCLLEVFLMLFSYIHDSLFYNTHFYDNMCHICVQNNDYDITM